MILLKEDGGWLARVQPDEIDKVVCTHPKVLQVLTCGVPYGKYSRDHIEGEWEIVVCFIVLKNVEEQVGLDEIRNMVSEAGLPETFKPAKLHFVSWLPSTAS